MFAALVDEHKGIVRGELVTAMDLPKERQASVKEQLAGQLKTDLVLEFSSDPGILGGVVLKVGDRVFDASLRAQLAGMKEQIKRGE